MEVRDYPFEVVQFSCGKGLHNGKYKKSVLIEKYTADIPPPDLRAHIARDYQRMMTTAGHESSNRYWYYLYWLVPPALILGVTLYKVPGESWAWLLLVLGLFVANIIWIFVTVVKVLIPYPENDQDKDPYSK